MRQLLRRLAVTALLAAVAALGTATVAPNPAAAAEASPRVLESQVTRLINSERAKHGCPALRTDTRITAAARAHSTWMARTGRFAHTGRSGFSFATRVKKAGYPKPSAENIAWGHHTASAVVGGWLKSPGHRTNILDCRSETTGVGVVFAAGGAPYYTQDFGY